VANSIDVKLAPGFETAIECFNRIHKAVDAFTANHDKLVGELVEVLALHMDVSKEGARTLNYGSTLHDIGKISISAELLRAPRKLSDTEFRQVQRHSIAGFDILKPNNTPFFDLAADIALAHHEYADGSGYPMGLYGAGIPLAVKIVTLCDVYEALRSRRSYKNGLTHDEATHIIVQGDDKISPAIFDPKVLCAFREIEGVFARKYDSMCKAKPTSVPNKRTLNGEGDMTLKPSQHQDLPQSPSQQR